MLCSLRACTFYLSEYVIYRHLPPRVSAQNGIDGEREIRKCHRGQVLAATKVMPQFKEESGTPSFTDKTGKPASDVSVE
jgi:hypothetical protein